jgi:hypothetical protein
MRKVEKLRRLTQSNATSANTASAPEAFGARRQYVALMLFGIALGLSSFNAYAAATPPAGGRVLQCWFDEKGQRTCSDTLPPKEARRQRELLDQRGLTKKILPAQKTPEEYEAERREQAERERAEAYDRYLLQNYQNVGEIEKLRDERVSTLDSRLTLAQKTLDDTTAILTDLRRREEAAGGASGDTALQKQLKDYAAAREQNLSAISAIIQERKRLADQFDRDIARYKVLRSR